MSDYYINASTRRTITRHFSFALAHSGKNMYEKMLLKLIYVSFFLGFVLFVDAVYRIR